MKRTQFTYGGDIYVIYRITSFGEWQCVNLSTGRQYSFADEATWDIETEVVDMVEWLDDGI